MFYYAMKDGHCLGRFDSEIEAIRYSKRSGAIIESKEE